MLSTWPANTDLTPCFAIERRQISVLAHGGAKWQYARCQTFCRFWRRPCASTRRCVCQRSLTGGVCQRSLSGSHCRPLSAPCRACTRRQTAAAGAGRGCGIRRAPPLPAAARWAPRRTAPSVVAFGCAAPTRPPARMHTARRLRQRGRAVKDVAKQRRQLLELVAAPRREFRTATHTVTTLRRQTRLTV